MPYLCPHHETPLTCSRCDALAVSPEQLDAACQVIDERQLWGKTLDYPRFEMHCPTCGKGLTCVQCIMAAIDAALTLEEK